MENQYASISQLEKICKCHSSKIRNFLDLENIQPSIVKENVNYYHVPEVKNLMQKYKTIRSIVEEGSYSIDYRTVGKEVKNKGIVPFYEKGQWKYYNKVEIVKVIEELLRKRKIDPYTQKTVSLRIIAEKNKVSEGVLRKLVNYQNITPKKMKGRNFKLYDVDEVERAYNELIFARTHYKTIHTIGNEYDINRDMLKDAVKLLDIQPKYIHDTSYYDENEVLSAFKKRREIIEENIRRTRVSSFYDKLHHSLQKLVDDFIELRENDLVITYGNYSTKKNVAHPEHNLPQIKSRICSALYKIAVYRLNQNNQEIMYPIFFDITSISKKDHIPINKSLKNTSQRSMYTALKPFLLNELSNYKVNALKSGDYTQLLAFHAFELNVEEFLAQFPKHVKDGKHEKHPKKITKSFLTHKECVEIYNLLLTDPRTNYPIRNATMWVLGTVLCIRPQECLWLRIEYFKLDSNGLLNVDDNGWGLLNIPEEASKHGISPSNEFYQTPVPPNSVGIINNYLKWLYSEQGKHNPRGKGYFFRRLLNLPESGLKSVDTEYMHRIRSLLDFLNPDQQNDFELKASRRSMNNLFVNAQKLLPERLRGRTAEVARSYQMRHKISIESQEFKEFEQGNMGENHYTAQITKEQFYSVLDHVINFPWDLQKIKLWEVEKGFIDLDEDILKTNFNDEEYSSALKRRNQELEQKQNNINKEKIEKNKKLQARLDLINEKLDHIKVPPNSKNEFDKWRKDIATLKKEKKELENYINKSN